MSDWKTIDSAPKDGTKIFAYGQAVKGFPSVVAWNPDEPREPAFAIIWWMEGWYAAEEPIGDGVYTKTPKKSFDYWAPEPQTFRPTHWMSLPVQPDGCDAIAPRGRTYSRESVEAEIAEDREAALS